MTPRISLTLPDAVMLDTPGELRYVEFWLLATGGAHVTRHWPHPGGHLDGMKTYPLRLEELADHLEWANETGGTT